jgi:lipopolysaccharide export system permease protein
VINILDRYILWTFIKNYLISFLVLVGLYIALDMVFNFDDVVEPPKASVAGALSFGKIIVDIAMYYAYQVPLFFVHLSGMITVVAASFTLMRLSRFNELTAMLAAGTSLLRVAMWVVIAGVILNLVFLVAVQELVIPNLITQLTRSHEEMHSEQRKSYQVQMMQDSNNGLVSAAEYTPPAPGLPARILFLDVIERDKDLMPIGHLYADEAVWNNSMRQWDLTNGKHVRVLRPDEVHPEPETDAVVYKSDVTPDEIALWRGGDYVQLLATARINDLLLRPKSYGVTNLLRTKHLRFTQPLVNIILLLLAIPTVLTREPGNLKTAAMKCLVLCGLCMGCVFLAYQLAASPPNPNWVQQWPAAMAWVPIIIFGPLSVWLLDRVKT